MNRYIVPRVRVDQQGPPLAFGVWNTRRAATRYMERIPRANVHDYIFYVVRVVLV